MHVVVVHTVGDLVVVALPKNLGLRRSGPCTTISSEARGGKGLPVRPVCH